MLGVPAPTAEFTVEVDESYSLSLKLEMNQEVCE